MRTGRAGRRPRPPRVSSAAQRGSPRPASDAASSVSCGRGGPAGPQRVVDGQHLVVAQRGQLGGPAQVLRQLRVAVLLRHRRLALQRVRVDAQVGQAELAAADRLQGQLADRPPGQRRAPRGSARSLAAPPGTVPRPGAPGRTQARSSAISAITVVWYRASMASSVYGLRAGSGVPPLAWRAAFAPSSRYSSRGDGRAPPSTAPGWPAGRGPGGGSARCPCPAARCRCPTRPAGPRPARSGPGPRCR